MMVEAQNFFQMPPLVLGIILIGVISLVMDAVVRLIERQGNPVARKDVRLKFKRQRIAGHAWRKGIVIQGVGLTYSSAAGSFEALRDINLAIEPGKFICLGAPQGAAKRRF